MATFAEYLAEVAAGREPCDWPVFVAASLELDLEPKDDPGNATLSTGGEPVFTAHTARRFLDHPCIYTSRTADAERLSIGRSSQCDYRIAHSSVSGSHAELVKADGAYSILDADSTNGTFVENRRLEPQKPTEIRPNALIHFGNATFYWVEPQMARTLARVPSP